ncbi:MAG: DUF2339 domain-containing protein [Rhizobiaceae bacterium]|nr:DUF2339 domain-containing protein [Rhizobiaceae bacterium]MCV0408059.1 DUF2339 domain-containing protein [Rhizobiaceae bacterium]
MTIDVILLIGLLLLWVGLRRQGERIRDLEAALGTATAQRVAAAPEQADDIQPAEPTEAETAASDAFGTPQADEEPAGPGPWATAAARAEAEAPIVAARPDIETAIGTRWAVWIGGIALALGGIFLVRYTIEAGFFGPGVRIAGAVLFGLLLAVAGEYARRSGFSRPIGGLSAAYIPAILTAVSAFTLFGAIYAAHAVYFFIGPTAAFLLLALVAFATLGMALIHGQALAGLGLLGSYLTPMLVSSEAPNPWTLFIYLSIVMVFAAAIAARQRWRALMVGSIVGGGLWSLLFLAYGLDDEARPLLVLQLVVIGALVFLWLPREKVRRFDPAAITVAGFAAVIELLLPYSPAFAPPTGALTGSLIIVAMLAAAVLRPAAWPLLQAGGLAALAIKAEPILLGQVNLDLRDRHIAIDGSWLPDEGPGAFRIGVALALVFLVTCAWLARRLAADHPLRAAAFAIWAVLLPLATLSSAWFSYANLDVDWTYAALALVLAGVLAVVAETTARVESPPQAGGHAVSILAAGAAAAFAFALMAGLTPLPTTILTGLATAGAAALTRYRAWPVIGWIAVALAALTMARVIVDPALVGAAGLSTTPFFNALLPGYLIPAFAFAFAAWQLARTTAGRPMLAMQAFATVFALVGAGMLVRHAMNGGLLVAGDPTLAEQAIHTLIAIGAGAVLLELDTRSPSPVFRWGSVAAGVASTLFITASHFIVLNPLFTNESTGTIPVFNLLLLAYLMPAGAMAALAYRARERRPRWYVTMLALTAAALAFAYVSLSVRRLFQGEFIGLWKGMDGLETYTYSAVWLVLGVAILAIGLKLGSRALRLASAVLVVTAVAKVFLFDMSELEGILRALSFMGLGVVLIGIGMVYQRMLASPGAPAGPATEPEPEPAAPPELP